MTDPIDRDGDTGARPLRTGCHHYWEENIHRHNVSFSKLTPFPPIEADPGGGIWDTSSSTTLLLNPGAALGLQGFSGAQNNITHHIPPWQWSPGIKVTWPQRKHKPPQEIKGILFFATQHRSGRPGQCRRLVRHLLEKKKTKTYQPTKDGSLLIIILKKNRVYSHKSYAKK